MIGRVAMIPYANTAPFRHLGPPRGCEFVTFNPRQGADALRAGRVDATLLPVGALPTMTDLVEPVGDLGIAAAGPVRSVLLFSDVPLEELGPEHRVRLTSHSASSVRLLALLLSEQSGREGLPRSVGEGEAADAELVIGDRALQRVREPGRAVVVDLAQEWWEWQRWPFVFARLVMKKDGSEELRDALEQWAQRFQDREEELLGAVVETEAGRLRIPAGEMGTYLRGMRRVLGVEEDRGQELFLGMWDRFSKLKIVY